MAEKMDDIQTIKGLAKLHSELKSLRQQIHAEPETAFEERRTADKILQYLEQYPPDELITELGGTGIAAVYQGKGEGLTVLIRTELDALPIQEVNNMDYRSKIEGKSHKCGHDGHMVMVAGLAALLHEQRPAKGRVVLLFQPAEEIGAGAKAVLEDERFEQIVPDYAFALHNLPGLPLGDIYCKPGSFTPAVKSMLIKLHGKTSHAAEPEHGINPSLAVAEISLAFNELVNNDVQSADFQLLTPVMVRLGEDAYGTSAGYAEMGYTLRVWDNEQMNQLTTTAEQIVEQTAHKYKLKAEMSYMEEFAANVNPEELVELIEAAAQRNSFTYHEMNEPVKWGEDFGLISDKYKGAMFGLGSGEKQPALHNPDYDFPDELIPYGLGMFYELIKQLLEEVDGA